MTFPFIAVTLDTLIAIFGCPKPSFGRLGPSFFPPRGSLCQLVDSLRDYGSSRKDTWGSRTRLLSNDFAIILRPHFESFSGFYMLTSMFFLWAWFQVTFCTDFWVELLTVGTLKTRFS